MVRKIDRKDLAEVRNLKDAFILFGVDADEEKVNSRDIVIMTSVVSEGMKKLKKELVENGEFEKAAKVRDRLRMINEEFLNIQVDTENNRQDVELARFARAQTRLEEKNDEKWDESSKQVEIICAGKWEDLLHAHEIQRENLELSIKNLSKPPVRFSKRLLEMIHSEKHLCKLDQFEDARAVRKRISELKPKEIAKHEEDFQRKCEALKVQLQTRHDFELAKMREKLHDMRLKNERKMRKECLQTELRISNHKRDMIIRHNITDANPEQFSKVQNGKVRPVVTKRKHFFETDAGHRGTQLLEKVQGHAIKGVQSLCKIHEFDSGFPQFSARKETLPQ